MTLTRFVTKNAFRNKRRSVLTALSIAFSLLLLTILMTVWRAFYLEQGSPDSAQRLIVRHKVSLVFFLPAYYREKIRALPGVKQVVPETWFGGLYKDNKPQNQFAQFGTDPNELLKVLTEFKLPQDQLEAWQKDRAGCIVDAQLAKKFGWKIGDRIHLMGTIFPINPEFTIRGIYTAPTPTESLYFNNETIEQGYPDVKGRVGFYGVLADAPDSVTKVAKEIDDMFRNAERPTKTESEHAFLLDFIASLGNVKLFIMSISLAVVFAILLVSANTLAMSIRERTREVAVLKTLGFTRKTVLGLFVSEAVVLSLAGGVLGVLGASALLFMMAHSPQGGQFFNGMKLTAGTVMVSLIVAALVGLISASVPSWNASRQNIVEGLRHIG
jgi:putative ABC transport system permease protein